MRYIKGIPTETKVLVKHRNHAQKIEGIIECRNDVFYFYNPVLSGGHGEKFGYKKSWSFDSTSGGYTEGIRSIELLEPDYDLF